MTDFSSIYLSKPEQKAFDKFDDSGEATLTIEEFELLRHTGLIQERLGSSGSWSGSWPSSGKACLSGLGVEYQRFRNAQREASRKEARRYWITTGIALAALAKSFMPELRALLAWLLQL